MGREAKRIHKDFDWPLDKVWFGYMLPPTPCELCNMTGKTPSGKTCPLCWGEKRESPKLEPPNGWEHENSNGWQMWETCSEGSPISPVCDTPEDLARWLADNDASAFGSMTATYDEWLGMIKAGSCFSAALSDAGLESGVAAVARRAVKDSEATA